MRGLQDMTLCCCLLLLVWSVTAGPPTKPPPARPPRPPPPPPREPPLHTIITNSSLPRTLRSVATREGAVLYTTFMLIPLIVNSTFQPVQPETHKNPISILRTQLYYLARTGMDRHRLLVTADERTWRLLHALGFTAYLDRTFPRWGGYDGRNIEPVVHKYWFGLKATELGYGALYLDYDAMALGPRGPLLAPFAEPYDLQALSAWTEAELPRMGETLHRTCGLYLSVIETKVRLGAMVKEYTAVMPGNFTFVSGKTPNASVPCQSTGVMYFKPSRALALLLSTMLHRLTEHAPYQWESAALNEVVIHFLWGLGGEAPLRYRLLPVDQFHNIGVNNERRKLGLRVVPVILHAGGLNGHYKIRGLQDQQLWQGDFDPLQAKAARPSHVLEWSAGALFVLAVAAMLARRQWHKPRQL